MLETIGSGLQLSGGGHRLGLQRKSPGAGPARSAQRRSGQCPDRDLTQTCPSAAAGGGGGVRLRGRVRGGRFVVSGHGEQVLILPRVGLGRDAGVRIDRHPGHHPIQGFIII